MSNEELSILDCIDNAIFNLENLGRLIPSIKSHPHYLIAMSQLEGVEGRLREDYNHD